MNTPRYSVRPYQDGDEHEILRLFNRVFVGDSGVDSASPEFGRIATRTLAAWRWEYQQNPAGQQISVAQTEDGRIIAHYACLPVRMHLFGRVGLAGQGVDSMVDPEFRRGLQKEGPFLAAARHYFATWGHRGVCALGYGYPNAKAFRVGVRVLGYQPLFERLPTLYRNFFQHPNESDLPPLPDPALTTNEIARFGAEHDALWTKLRDQYPCCIVRDATYLNWRYLSCPHIQYRCIEVRDGATLRGWFVLRANWTGVPILAIADLFAPTDDAGVVALAIRRTLAEARATQQARVELWLPEQHPLHRHALSAGLDSERCNYSLCVMPYWPELDLESIRRHWYFTIGDSDLF